VLVVGEFLNEAEDYTDVCVLCDISFPVRLSFLPESEGTNLRAGHGPCMVLLRIPFVWMRAIAGRPFARLRSESASLLLIRRGANQVGYPGRSCQIALRCALRVELGGRKLPHRCGIEDLLGLHRFRLHYDSNWVSCIFNARVKMVSFVFHSSALHSGQKLYIYLPSRHTGPPLSQSRSLWKC